MTRGSYRIGNGLSMKRLSLVILLVSAPGAPSIDTGLASLDGLASSNTIMRSDPRWRPNSAFAQIADVPANDALAAARGPGTAAALSKSLTSYPAGFYSDLARAYIKKRDDNGSGSSVATALDTGTKSGVANDVSPTEPGKPAVMRGGQ